MNALKSKFTGFLRGMLRHFDDNEPVATNTVEPAVMPEVAAAPEPAQTAPKNSNAVRSPARTVSTYTPQSAPAKAVGIDMPLQPILAALPPELRSKVTTAGTATAMISIPADKVLTQLATGSVKISFGELRRLAPGAFAKYGEEHDSKSVSLPLNHVLAQLNPALLSRPAAQKRVEVSDDIASPFDALGGGLKISTEKMKAAPATPPAPAEPMPVPLSRLASPVSETPVAPPPVVPPPSFAPRWTTPAPAASGNGNGGSNGSKNGANDSNGSNGSNGAHSPRPAALNMTPPAVAPKADSAPQASGEPPLLVSLATISDNWPDELKLEISQLGFENAQVALPVNLVEPALKRGRVVFLWRDVRSWIKSAAVAVSAHDGVELELPLKVLAPLFFARQKNGAGGQKKVSVSKEIPDTFFGSTPPASAPAVPAPAPVAVAAAAPPADTNFLLRSVQPATSDSEFARKGGTDFKSRSSAPADIIASAMKLPGVAGALITLSDGLKVASQVPAELNGDTLAAFIPQIFSRVNQGSRELRMGDLNNLSFTVGNVSWKIFRVNAVYFAAFGRTNESLPGAQLAALAVELDHKK